MATHSSILAWRIQGTEKPSGLLSMGSHRVRHDLSDLAAVAGVGMGGGGREAGVLGDPGYSDMVLFILYKHLIMFLRVGKFGYSP